MQRNVQLSLEEKIKNLVSCVFDANEKDRSELLKNFIDAHKTELKSLKTLYLPMFEGRALCRVFILILADILQYCTKLEQIELVLYQIKPADFALINASIAKLSSLKRLNLCCNIENDESNILLEFLKKLPNDLIALEIAVYSNYDIAALNQFLQSKTNLKILSIDSRWSYISKENGDLSILELLETIAKLNALEELTLGTLHLKRLGAKLVQTKLKSLIYGIKKMSGLKKLSLNLAYLSDVYIKIISNIFDASSLNLQSLALEFCYHSRQIHSIFNKIKYLANLKELSLDIKDITLNDIDTDQAYADIGSVLENFTSNLPKLEILQVKNFAAGEKLYDAFAKAIGKLNSLKSLIIDDFNIQSNLSATELFFQNLAQHKNLEILKLSPTIAMQSTTVLYLSKALQKLPKLKELKIIKLTISKSNIDAFVSATEAFKQLKSLSIRMIKFTDGDLVPKFMEAIGSLTTLTDLNLSNNMLCEYSTLEESIIRPIGNLTRLKELELHNNNIGSKGANILTTILPKLLQLKSLALSGNNFIYQDQVSLIDTLKKLPKLNYGNIDEISVNSPKEEKKLKDHFAFQPLYSSYILYFPDSYEALLPAINDVTMIILGMNDRMALYDDIDLDYIHGMRLYDAGYLKEALNCYYKILNSNYKRIRIYVNIGNILLRLGKFKESLDVFEQGLANIKIPNNNLLLLGKANSLYQLSRFSEALEIYNELRLDLEKYDKVYNYSLLTNIGASYLQLKEYGNAFEVLSEADKIYNRALISPKSDNLHKNNLDKAIDSLNITEEYVPLLCDERFYFPGQESRRANFTVSTKIAEALWENNLLKKGKKFGIVVPYYLEQQYSGDTIRYIGIIVDIIDVYCSLHCHTHRLSFNIKKYAFFDVIHKINGNISIAKIEDFAFSNIKETKELKQKFHNLVRLFFHYGFIRDFRISTNMHRYLNNSKHNFVHKVMLVIQNISNILYNEKIYKEFLSIIINNNSHISHNKKLISLIDCLSLQIEKEITSLDADAIFPMLSEGSAKSIQNYIPCLLFEYRKESIGMESTEFMTGDGEDMYSADGIKQIVAQKNEFILLHKRERNDYIFDQIGSWSFGPLFFGLRCIIRDKEVIPTNLIKIKDIKVYDNKIYVIPIKYQFKIIESEQDQIIRAYNTIINIYKLDQKNSPRHFLSVFEYAPYNANLEQISIEEYIHSKVANLVVDCDLNVAEDASLLDVLKLIEEVFKKHVVEEEVETTEDKQLENSEEKQAEPQVIAQDKQECDVIVSKFVRLESQISELQLPEHVHKYLMKELQGVTNNNDRESRDREDRIRNFLDLPWNKYDQEEEDLKKVQNSLDKYHYGLSEIKEEILDYLANKDKTATPILCLVGAPGVGKTSIAEAIAKSVGRKCVKLNLGGMYDQSLIRGHHYTYVSAACGQPLSLIRQAGTWNPVMILDEIDKVAVDRGDVNSALLSLLDPANNNEFTDDYYDVPLDMSKIMYIATANNVSQIPYVLRSRMHIIELSGYTETEKMVIIKQYVLPSIMEHYVKEGKSYKIPDKVIKYLLHHYVQESGVRDLKRKIQKLINRYYREEKTANEQKFDISFVHKTLGRAIYLPDKSDARFVEGLVNGLSCSAMGGALLPIEVVVIPGKGEIKTTGSLGDVLKESIQIAITTVKRNLQNGKTQNIKTENNCDKYQFMQETMDKLDIHVNCLKGSIPKEGPSAGIALYTGIYSALTGSKIRQDIAMTGEIGLLGNVLTIGGLKEKICAAIRESIKMVIVPQKNARDIEQLPDEIKSAIEIKTIANVSEIHSLVFEQNIDNNKKWYQKIGQVIKDKN